LIDTHAHLDFPDFKDEIKGVMERADHNGVKGVICVGISEKSSSDVLDIAGQYSQIWASAGIHPHDANNVSERYESVLEKLALSPQVVAIGETGLDYFKDRAPRELQQNVFRAQLRLALKVQKPVIIHCRDAYQELMKIMKEENIEQVGGILHCFSGDENFARQSLELGLYISFGGIITYPKAHRLREVVKIVPLDRIFVETDSPFLTPQPMRGKRNEPAYVKYNYDQIASLKNITREYLQTHCRRNLTNLFNITL